MVCGAAVVSGAVAITDSVVRSARLAGAADVVDLGAADVVDLGTADVVDPGAVVGVTVERVGVEEVVAMMVFVVACARAVRDAGVVELDDWDVNVSLVDGSLPLSTTSGIAGCASSTTRASAPGGGPAAS